MQIAPAIHGPRIAHGSILPAARHTRQKPNNGITDFTFFALVPATLVCSQQTKNLFCFSLYPFASGAASDRGHSARNAHIGVIMQ